MYYSVRMRSAQGGPHERGGKHISGAEKLTTEAEMEQAALAMIRRALRHPRGNCASLYKVHAQRASSAGSQDALLLAEQVERQWLKVHRHILAFTATLPAGQVMRLRGEDALAEPELYFAQLAEWLGIRTDAAAIDAMLHPEDSPYARPGPPSAPYGNNPGFIDDPRLRRGWPATGPLHGPLEWSALGAGFTTETLALARQFGYR